MRTRFALSSLRPGALRPRPLHGLLAGSIALGLALPAVAQPVSDDELRAEIDSLRARLELLEARLSGAPPGTPASPTPQPSAPAPATTVDLGPRGLQVRHADSGFELRLRGGLHLDHREFLGSERAGADGSFTFRRIRPTLEGRLGPLAAFRITPELAGDSVTLLDAWVDVTLSPTLTLRAGRSKGPVSLERLLSFTALPLVERGFAAELAPNRALGLQAFGALSSGKVQYALGIANGGPDGRNDASQDADDHAELQGRLFFEPWRGDGSVLSGLGFGVAATSGKRDGSGNGFLPRYRTPGQDVFFSHRANVEARGDHTRWSPQVYWYHDRFGLIAEHIVSRQSVRLTGDPRSGRRLSHSAWTATGTWLLTGEPASYRGLAAPGEPFAIGNDGWGAFELAARVGELDVDNDAFPLLANPDSAATRARSWGLGLNWYLNSSVKVQIDHQRTRFDGGAAGGADRADERALFSRLQVAF